MAAAAPLIQAGIAGTRAKAANDTLSGLGQRALDIGNMNIPIPMPDLADLVEAGTDMVKTAGEYEQLQARLDTLTGSTESAQRAMAALQEVAATMPFSFQNVTKAFVDMATLGLEPSERAMRAYGEMAAGLNEPLNKVIQAIGDAASGNFGGLEKLGITAKAVGDEVTFTFNGISTTVKNRGDEIQSYLTSLAENNFAGAMGNQLETVQGKFTKVSDSVDRLLVAISNESGLTAASKEAMSWMSETADFSAKVIEQEGLLAGLWISLGKVGNDLYGFEEITPKVETTAQAIARLKGEIISTNSSMRLSEKELIAWGKASTVLQSNGQNGAAEGISQKIQDLAAKVNADLKHIEELKATLKEFEGKAPPPEQDRLAGLAKNKAKADQNINKVVPPASCAPCKAPDDKSGDEQGEGTVSPLFGGEVDQLAQRLESVQSSLASENEKLREHYDEQQFIIEDAFQAGLIKDEERRALTEELESQHKERLTEIEARSMSAQERLWQDGWEGKAQVVSGVMGSLSQLMDSENKKQFEIGKKAAIAQAVIDTTLSAQKAYTSLAGIPLVGPALGAAAAAAAIAAGVARVNSIKSQSFSGGGGGGGGGGAPSLPGGSTASGGGSAATGVTTSSKADAPVERQRVFVEFQGNEDSKMTARQWREFMRNLQEEAGDAQLEF